MRHKTRHALPDLTNAVLAMVFVNLLWSLALIWAALGLPAVLVTAVFLDYLITRLDHLRRRG
ncbi:MAG: histidinol phosphate aminotransferase [Paracoccaceae bacterium]